MSLKDIQRGGKISSAELRRAARAQDAAKPATSFSVAGSVARMAGGFGSIAADDGWFPARVVDVVSGGYTFVETWIDSTGAVSVIDGGRKNTTDDVAVSITGATAAPDDDVLCRRSRGAAGQKWELIPLSLAGGGADCGGGCGSLVGLLDDATLKLALQCASGEFAGMDEEQFEGVFAFGAAGTWTFEKWDGDSWEPVDIEWFTGSAGPVVYTGADETLTLDTIELKPLCFGSSATFAGGPQRGFDGDPAIRAMLLPCAANDFIFKVACSCTPLDGFTGDGWYGIVAADEDCVDDGPCEAVFLTTDDGSACDIEIKICTGRHDTEEEAEAACAATIESECCTDGLLPETLYLNFSGGTGDCTCLNGLKIPMEYNGSAWDSGGAGDHPCSVGPQNASFLCDSGTWNVSYGSPGGCLGTDTAAADDCTGDVVASGTMTISESGPGDCCVGDIDWTVTRS